ncbi:TetR/AcrR family transcriptional regulator [Catenulispora yoronensis]|uniref:TetR/AcrR family transcriptional regulator n=1 Tax=Catenulispora yoronensis TaxID=450799 RepID=A0ABP5FN73_9ACTN
MTDVLPHKRRSDAVDNRSRIQGAARTLFSAEGLDVPLREIARRAGVGPATLYRHFPTKQLLIAEAFADQLRACRTIVDEGCADPDPWRGLCSVIERICELHARDRGFTEAFLATVPGTPDITGREYTVKAVAGLAQRAKDAGRLRPDFVVDDLILVLMANKGIHAASDAVQVMASRRFAGLVIQAFEARPHHAPLPPPARLGSAASRSSQSSATIRFGTQHKNGTIR